MNQTLHNPASRQIVDTLRLNDRDLLRLVMIRLKNGAGGITPEPNDLPPIDPRLIAALPRMLMRIHDNVANLWTTYLVKPCDIHANAVVFLHGSFVYKGAKCAGLLRRSDGSPAQLAATVLHCRHLTGRLHQLVATFEQPIRLADYQFAEGVSIEASMAAGRASVDPPGES